MNKQASISRGSQMRIALQLFFSLLILSAHSVAHAIFNIESVRLEKRNADSGGTIGVSFDRSEGNTDTLKLKLAAQGIIKHKSFEHIGIIERQNGSAQGVENEDRFFAHLRTTWPAERFVAGEVYGQLEQNPFNRLSLRGIVGTGARLRAVNEEKFVLFIGTGVYWSRETLKPAEGTTDAATEDFWRMNTYAALLFPLAENVDLSSTAYVQPALDDFNDIRILETTQAKLKVNDYLAVGLNYTLNYDSRPPQRVQTLDQTYGTSLMFSF